MYLLLLYILQYMSMSVSLPVPGFTVFVIKTLSILALIPYTF
jgi:hypothetical protein